MSAQTTRQALRLAAIRLRERWASYRRRIPEDRGGESTKTDTPVQAVWDDERHLIAGYAERVACLLNPDVTASWNVLARLTGQRRAQMTGRGGPLVTKAGTRRKWFRSHKLQPIPSPPESEIPEHLSTAQIELDTVIRRKQRGFWHRAWWGDDSSLSHEQVALLGLSGALARAKPVKTTRDEQVGRPVSYHVACDVREAGAIRLSRIKPFGKETAVLLGRNREQDGFLMRLIMSLQGGLLFVEFSNLIFGLMDDMMSAVHPSPNDEPARTSGDSIRIMSAEEVESAKAEIARATAEMHAQEQEQPGDFDEQFWRAAVTFDRVKAGYGEIVDSLVGNDAQHG